MGTHPSILLIEDSPGERELFRLALAQTGLDVALFTERETKAAFHFIEDRARRALPPSLILLDLHLSGQNGCDFLKRLRADARFGGIPVVVFTTSDDRTDLAACYTGGANGYVVKPGTFDELVHCITAVCRYWLDWNRMPVASDTRC